MFISSNPSAGGGVQEHIYYLSDGLRKRGHTVEIFGGESENVRYKNFHSIGYTIELPTLNGNWGYIHLLKGEIKPKQIFSSKKFDILHIHEPYSPFATWDLIQNTTIPKVTTFHNAWDDNSINNAINSLLPIFKPTFSKLVKGTIFVSEITKKRWLDLCSHKTKKVVIYNGLDLFKFQAKEKKANSTEILFVGRLVQRKGIHYLLKASLQFLDELPNAHVSILGKGPEYNWCKDFIHKHNLSKRISLMGEIIGEAKIKYYQRAHIFCAPYSDEAHPITILEAMGCGCTIVGFKNESIKEELKNYPTDELIVKKDVASLAHAIVAAANSAALQTKVRKWCKREIKKYSWDIISKKTENMYYQVLGKD